MGSPLPSSADVVICGAGIAGLATAFHLAVRHGCRDVVVVDERAPLTLTSDKSTECYRNWWPGPDDAMVRFMDRSIDLLDELAAESENAFHLNRRGYLYLTADASRTAGLEAASRAISALGAGELRVHRDGSTLPPRGDGADLLLGGDTVRRAFPFVTGDVVAALHPRRCGWLDAQQLGMTLRERAEAAGARLLRGRVRGVEVDAAGVAAVRLATEGGEARIATRRFVDAAGPYVAEVAALVGVELPIFHELHLKVTFDDVLGAIPRDAPLTAWLDPVRLDWSDAERAELLADESYRHLAEELPGGVHFRPEGDAASTRVLMLWAYDTSPRDVVVPPPLDETYPEVVLRGVARMVPAMAAYLDEPARLRRPYVDGGYYTKTRENRPLVGPLPTDGAFVVGALSGYGVMAAMAAGDLLARHLVGNTLPPWAPAFTLARYEDPAYRRLLAAMDAVAGQL